MWYHFAFPDSSPKECQQFHFIPGPPVIATTVITTFAVMIIFESQKWISVFEQITILEMFNLGASKSSRKSHEQVSHNTSIAGLWALVTIPMFFLSKRYSLIQFIQSIIHITTSICAFDNATFMSFLECVVLHERDFKVCAPSSWCELVILN